MGQGLRIMIVEDDAVIGESLHLHLRQLGHSPLPPVRNLERARHLLTHNDIDAALLDIHLHRGDSGIDLARQLDQDRQIPYIYLTAYSDDRTLTEVSKTHPSGYLVKPIRRAELKAALTLVAARIAPVPRTVRTASRTGEIRKRQREAPHIFVHSGGTWARIEIEDILFLESARVYTVIHTTSGEISTRKPLSEFVEELDRHGIMRIHRSHALNLAHITAFDRQAVAMGDRKFKVSATYRRAIHERLTGAPDKAS